MMNKVNLSLYDNSWYKPGKNFLVRIIWHFLNAVLFSSSLIPINALKIIILKLFGSNVGKGVVIKPGVYIRYPWNLSIGDFVWIGDKAIIDNHGKVRIGDNVCISQHAMILTGSHNPASKAFDLVLSDIVIEDGVWIGAKAIVNGGIRCASHSILSVNSVAIQNLLDYTIYSGNPAIPITTRVIL